MNFHETGTIGNYTYATNKQRQFKVTIWYIVVKSRRVLLSDINLFDLIVARSLWKENTDKKTEEGTQEQDEESSRYKEG